MNPIVKIQAENFQSHRKTAIEIGGAGTLTVLVGIGDSGKTALALRAPKWLCQNYPSGDGFIRIGADLCAVTITLASGHKITRERSRGKINRYRIVSPDGEVQVFEGFGNSVPLEVQELTGVRPVTIGDMELNLNLADQLDGPFMGKSVSAPAKAKVLGKLAGTEAVDYAGKQLATDLHRRNQDEARLGKEIERLGEQVAKFDWLPGLEKKIGELQAILEQVQTAEQRRQRLEGLFDRMLTVSKHLYDARKTLIRWEALPEAEQALTAAENAASKTARLELLVTKLDSATAALDANSAILKRWHNLPEAKYKLDEVEGAVNKANRLKRLADRWDNTEMTLANIRAILERWSNLPKAEQVLVGADEAFKRMAQLGIYQEYLNKANCLLTDAQNEVQRWAHLPEAERALGEADKAFHHITTLKGYEARWSRLEDSTSLARQQRQISKQKVKIAETAYREALLEAGTCPLCGGEITQDKLEEVIRYA